MTSSPSSRLEPPGGRPPPASAAVAGTIVDLVPLATEICRRYREEFPDEAERYGDAGIAWCVHDTQYLLAWAADEAGDREGTFEPQLLWLADLLAARSFPLDRLARDLDLCAEVLAEGVPGSGPVQEVLRGGAATVRRHAHSG